MATLNRYDGTKTVYSISDLEQLLAHLSISNSAGCSDGQVFFWAASPYLVIVDLAWLVNRKLSELFTVVSDAQFPFHLAFVSDSDYISLSEALLRCGYAGQPPMTSDDLAKNYMAIYQSTSGGADSKVVSVATGSSLVATSGNGGTPATLKGMLGGQGILLSESGTDITITSNSVPITSVGSGLSLIDPSSTPLAKYLVSLAVQNGLTLNRNAGVVTLGLGSTLKVQTLQSTGGLNALSLGNAGVNLVLDQIFDTEGNLLASFDQQLQFILSKDLKCRTLTATSVKADNLYVTGDSLAIPSGTQFKALSDSLASLTSSASTSSVALTNRVGLLETDNTTNKSSISSLTTRVTAVESSDSSKATSASVTALTTRVSSLETDNTTNKSSLSGLTTRVTAVESSDSSKATTVSVTALTNRVSTLETNSTSQTNGIASLTTTVAQNTTDLASVKTAQSSIVSAVTTNTSDISSLKTRVSTLESSSTSTTAAGSGILPFAASDIEARRKGIPQYSLYRQNVRGLYVMRYLADSAYQMNVIGGQSFMIQTSVSSVNGGWTIEWWAKTYRLFQQTMLCIQTTDLFQTMSFGLSGGGSFNIMWNGGQYSLAQPDVNEWYLYGCQVTAGSAMIYMSKQGQVASAPTVATVNVLGYENLGPINLYAGRDPSNYSFQGSIACPRLVNAPIYANYTVDRLVLKTFTGFPLDKSLDYTKVVLDGNPIVNKVSPTDRIVVTGTPVTAPVTDSVDNWVPV